MADINPESFSQRMLTRHFPIPEEADELETRQTIREIFKNDFPKIEELESSLKDTKLKREDILVKQDFEKLLQYCISAQDLPVDQRKKAGIACDSLFTGLQTLQQLQQPAPVQVGPQRLALVVENSCKFGNLLPSCLSYDKMKRGSPPITPTREKEMRQACSDGDGDACFGVGIFTMASASMWNQKQKQAQAATFINKACSLGNPVACSVALGLQMEDANWGESVKSCCEAGAMDCCFLAWQTELMLGRNYADSFKYAKKACDTGACLNTQTPLSPYVAVATAYLGDPGFDVGVKPDKAKAVSYLKKGCESCSDGASCAFYGGMLERGATGVRRDKKLATEFYAKACSEGQFAACAALYEVNTLGASRDWFQVTE